MSSAHADSQPKAIIKAMKKKSQEPGEDTPPGAVAGLGQEVEAQQQLAGSQSGETALAAALARAEKAEAAQAAAELALFRLREVESELQATARFREQLLGIVGHDLRNPLGAISMSAQFLILRGNLGDEDRRLIELVLKSVQRMDRMLSQLFALTRAPLGGDMLVERSATNLQDCCRQAIDELALGAKIRMNSSFQGDLSGSWDGGRLTAALSNLISYAIDHANPGTEVLITAHGEPTRVVIVVHYMGRPIAAELLPDLFASFRSGKQGPAAKPGHLGFGMYVANEIVASHSGTLQAQSTEGGTSFTVHLPRSTVA